MIKLYSATYCPQCSELKKMLNNRHVEFELCTDEDKMRVMGITHIPMLELDNQLLNMQDAIKWLNGDIK